MIEPTNGETIYFNKDDDVLTIITPWVRYDSTHSAKTSPRASKRRIWHIYTLWLVARLSRRLYGWCVNRMADFYIRNAGDRLVGVAPAGRSSRSSSTPTLKGKR